MSEAPQAPDWWQAQDGRWYPRGTEPVPGGTGGEVPFDVNPQLWQHGPQPFGNPPPLQINAITQYCITCGNGLVATAAICPRCGTPVSGTRPGQVAGKSRSAAVLLAVFLSFWSFLYTYRTAAWKFWLGLGLGVFCYILNVIIDIGTQSAVGLVVFVPIALGVWIWSIVDRSTTPL